MSNGSKNKMVFALSFLLDPTTTTISLLHAHDLSVPKTKWFLPRFLSSLTLIQPLLFCTRTTCPFFPSLSFTLWFLIIFLFVSTLPINRMDAIAVISLLGVLGTYLPQTPILLPMVCINGVHSYCLFREPFFAMDHRFSSSKDDC